MLKGKTIIVGVSGGIAAYKSVELVSLLQKSGVDVWVVMTPSAQKLVSPVTFRAISKNPVITDLFDDDMHNLPVPHIALAQKADLIVVAPATANCIAKLVAGLADDPLSTIVLASKCLKLIAPAMNSNMWENPITHENKSRLMGLGFIFFGPEEGSLACGDTGNGRMSEPKDIFNKILGLLAPRQDLKNKKILITAGGTQEYIDPVRFIGNRSSGKMGYSIAEAAAERGGQVTLIAGNNKINQQLKNVKIINITSSKEMHDAVMENKAQADVIVMAAAVADYEPKVKYFQKIKKDSDDLSIEFKKTKDILGDLGKNKNGTYLVGFALESSNLINNAKEKLEQKNLDMIIVNDTSAFDSDYSEITIIDKQNKIEHFCRAKKYDLAHRILDRIFAHEI